MKNILITTANSPYYQSLLTLINGVHLFGLDCVDKILVYDLGLSQEEKSQLNKLKLVEVLDYRQEIVSKHEKFLEPKSHVYKLYCLWESRKWGENIFWLDAGVVPIRPMCEIFQIIEQDEVFLVGDYHLNKNYTHTSCQTIMSANTMELEGLQLSSGICGYKSGGRYEKMFEEAFNFSLIPGCVDGDQENHRHDQSVLSILSIRHGCPRQNIDIYGYWTDINRNLETAKSIGAVIFVHRRGYENTSSLIYED